MPKASESPKYVRAAARRLAEGQSPQLIAAAEGWFARQGTKVEVVSVKDAVKRVLEAKTRAGVDVAKSYQKIFRSSSWGGAADCCMPFRPEG